MAMPGEPGSEHRRFEEMAVAHVLGGLTPAQGRTFRSHLLECADCRARVGELRAIAHELAGVERDEERERAAQTVELKEREDDDGEGPPEPGDARRWRRVRLVGIVGLIAFALLSVYTITLRSGHQQLYAEYTDRLEAALALEHGQTLPTQMVAPGVTATAKRTEEHVVLLMEGLTVDEVYGLYLMGEGQDGTTTTINSQPQRADDGSILVLAELTGDERALIVTEVDSGFERRPQGRRVFEASIPVQSDVTRSVGSSAIPRVSSARAP